jgi:rSAM/selenodomain-associated transferase 2
MPRPKAATELQASLPGTSPGTSTSEPVPEAAPSVSIVIPVYNESSTIKTLLASLAALTGSAEVIFVDGGSSDGTVELVPPCFKLLHSPKGRGVQMNRGAANSTGEILLFLHCDSELPPTAVEQVRAVMATKRVGCFGVDFKPGSLLLGFCSTLSNLRARYRHLAYGDQGLFIQRKLFFTLGGFPEHVFMEDYAFALKLREQLREHGERVGMTTERLRSSDRRFKQDGSIRVWLRMLRLRALYRQGHQPAQLMCRYRDIR